MADANPSNAYLGYMMAKDPAAGMRFQMQQALAQQMMQEGSDYGDSNQTVGSGTGTRVVPLNPLTGLAKMGERIAGGYMQGQQLQKLAEMMKSGKPASAPSGSSPTPQTIGNAMMGGNQPSGAQFDPYASPENYIRWQNTPDYMKTLMTQNGPTDTQKDFNNPALHDMVAAKLAKEGMMESGKGYFPSTALSAPSPAPQAAPPAVPTAGPDGALAPIIPPQPGDNAPLPPMGTPDRAAAIKDMASAMPGATPAAQAAGGQTMPVGGAAAIFNDQRPAAASQSPPNVAQMNDPAELDRRKALVAGDQKYLNETLLPAKDGAVAAKASIAALQNAAAIANANDLTRTGPTDPARVGYLKHLNDFLAMTGGAPIAQNEIANADAINKIGLRLTANMTKMLGSREAAQIFTKIQEANPSWYMQPQTLSLVSNLINADNDTAIGKYRAGYEAASKPGGMAQEGVNAYERENPAGKHIKSAFAASGMAGYDGPKDPDFAALPSGSKFYDLNPQSPTYGKQLVKH